MANSCQSAGAYREVSTECPKMKVDSFKCHILASGSLCMFSWPLRHVALRFLGLASPSIALRIPVQGLISVVGQSKTISGAYCNPHLLSFRTDPHFFLSLVCVFVGCAASSWWRKLAGYLVICGDLQKLFKAANAGHAFKIPFAAHMSAPPSFAIMLPR